MQPSAGNTTSHTTSQAVSQAVSQTVSTATIDRHVAADRAVAIDAQDRSRSGSGQGVRAVISLLLAGCLVGGGIAVAQRHDTAGVALPTAQEPNAQDGHTGLTAGQPSGQEPTVGQRVGRSGHPGARVAHLYQREPGIPAR